MKKVLKHYKEPNSIVFEQNRFTENENWDVVSYDGCCLELWRISPPIKSMVVFDGSNWKKCSTKEDFLMSISDLYPADLELFLWHPEALDGRLPNYP